MFSALEWPCFEGRHSCAVWSTAASGFSIASSAIVSPYAVPTWHLTSLKINKPEKRGRKPGTSWNGETRVERMGGISAGVGGGGGSARLY